jgi:hypothetical protein
LQAVLTLAGQERLIPTAAFLSMRPRLTEVLKLLEQLAPTDVEIHVPCAVLEGPRGWSIRH